MVRDEVLTIVPSEGGTEVRFDPEKLASLSPEQRDVLARDIAIGILGIPFVGRAVLNRALDALEKAAPSEP